MRITIAYRHYWPDTPPYGAMLKEIATWLADAGHEVTVITAQPSYKPEVHVPRQPWREVVDGVNIVRVRLLPEGGRGIVKLMNAGIFIAKASLRILFGSRLDTAMCVSTPPVLQAFAVSLAARLRGAKFVYHTQDLYPEIGVASGALKVGLIPLLLKRIDVFTQNRTDAVVVLSPDMAEVVTLRGARPKRLEIINNFALAVSDDSESSSEPSRTGRPARFIFAGNIGRFQNLEALVTAFGALEPGVAELEMVGDGRQKQTLMEICRREKIQNVGFHGHMPVDDVFRFMEACDYGVVSLTPGIFRFAYPSKTLTYLAAGLPILAMIEEESALARMVEDGGFGKAISWNAGADGIAAAVRELASPGRGSRNVKQAARSIYHPEAAKALWLALFSRLSNG